MGQRLDIDVNWVMQDDLYLLTGVSTQGRSWLNDNVRPDTPRHKDAYICKPALLPMVCDAASEDGMVVA